MAKVRVEVTEAEIRAGMPGSNELCPITMAIRRHIGPNLLAVNTNSGARLQSMDALRQCRPICKLPHSCTSFMDDFDGGIQVRPFTFVVEFSIPRLLGRRLPC